MTIRTRRAYFLIGVMVHSTLTFASGGARKGAPEWRDGDPKTAHEYQQCVKKFKTELESSELTALTAFRSQTQRLSHLRRSGRAAESTEIRKNLLSEAEKMVKLRPYVALMMFRYLSQDQFSEIIEKTIKVTHPAYQVFNHELRTTNISEGPQRLWALRKAQGQAKAQALQQELIKYYETESTLPKEARAQALDHALTVLTLVKTDLEYSQDDNVARNEISAQRLSGITRQVSMGVAGIAALGLALKFAGTLVVGGTSLGTAAGYPFAGKIAGVASVGAIGGGGAAAIVRAHELYSEAGLVAQYFHTPFVCELQKAISLDYLQDVKAILGSAAFGMAAGASATMLAEIPGTLVIPRIPYIFPEGKIIPQIAAKSVLMLVGGAVVSAVTYESYEATVKAMEFFEFKRYAREFGELGHADEAAKALFEAHVRAHEFRTHAIDAAIVGVLFYALFIQGEFLHALRHHEETAPVLAMSSDEMGPTAKSAGKILGVTADAGDDIAIAAKSAGAKGAASALAGDAADEAAIAAKLAATAADDAAVGVGSVAKSMAAKVAALKAAAAAAATSGAKAGILAPIVNQK